MARLARRSRDRLAASEDAEEAMEDAQERLHEVDLALDESESALIEARHDRAFADGVPGRRGCLLLGDVVLRLEPVEGLPGATTVVAEPVLMIE